MYQEYSMGEETMKEKLRDMATGVLQCLSHHRILTEWEGKRKIWFLNTASLSYAVFILKVKRPSIQGEHAGILWFIKYANIGTVLS